MFKHERVISYIEIKIDTQTYANCFVRKNTEA